MSENVIKKMNQRQAREDEIIQNYIKQRELETLITEEQKKRNFEQTKADMRAILDQQIKEREDRKYIDKQMLRE